MHSSLVTVKHEIYAFEEPKELQFEKSEQKQEEMYNNHSIIYKTAKAIKSERA